MTRETQIGESLEPRVASLETAVKQIAASIGNIESQMTAKNRVNWGVIISAIGLAVVMVAAIGRSYLAPIDIQIEFAKALFAEERTKRQDATAKIGTIDKAFEEIETQFRWSRASNSFAFATQQRLIQMLWKKVYAEDLPALDLIEIGPNGK